MKIFDEFDSYILFVKDIESLKIETITNGYLIVLAEWSGPSIVNCKKVIDLLICKMYSGNIILANIEILNYQMQIETFGNICNGWGEVFEISKGQITNKYMGKENYNELVKKLIK